MSAETSISFEPWETNRRLGELGLTEAALIRAAQRGLAAWSACTENHPPVFGGLSAWGETVCALREELMPLGWDRLNEANLPLVVNSDRTIALTVATGDEQTGRKDGMQPCTMSAKGPRTIAAIAANNQQIVLFPEMLPDSVMPKNGRITWLLLIHRDTQGRELRVELSRPTSMAPEGHVDGWAERIILRSTPFDELPVMGLDNPPETPEIDIDIKRRA